MILHDRVPSPFRRRQGCEVFGVCMSYRYQHDKSLTSYSRLNRKKQTDAERFLWQHLRNKQLSGLKFHRQYPINNYILDFYCIEKKLAVELDGSQHMQQSKYDEQRSKFLSQKGIQVLRFWDNETLQNTEGVLQVILEKAVRLKRDLTLALS